MNTIPVKSSQIFSVVDLFSGCGGMSFGFHRHPNFSLVAAADAEIGKPSSPRGALQCNSTYALNLGFRPTPLDLGEVQPSKLRKALGISDQLNIDVLSVCPPCTGFSRANPKNHISNDHRNNLVARAADFARALDASVVVMENAREVLKGNFPEHFENFRSKLESSGYHVHASVHRLERFGLPQIRERSLVIAVREDVGIVKTLGDLWSGAEIISEAITVRRALGFTPDPGDTANRAPSFKTKLVADRIKHIPHDGGSWIDLAKTKTGRNLLTPSMKRILESGKIGSHPDVYGRMAWEKPAPTIKRECSHVGNGRYAHPTENRLLTVREMASLQGFPKDFQFNGAALSNLYRHIGDAVPPLISYQLAHLVNWILTEKKPELREVFLPQTHLKPSDAELSLV